MVGKMSVRTKIGVPFAPVALKADEVTNTSISVNWKEPQPFYGTILAYTIKWSKKSAVNPINSTDVELTNCKIENLEPYTEYSVQVRASTEAGPGPWSSILTVRSAVGIPSVPLNIMAINITSTSILLTWTEPEPANGPDLEYLVSWGIRGSAITQVIVNELEFSATDLIPHTEYAFQVAAKTTAGLGTYSQRIFAQTKIGLPTPPQNLTTVEVTNTSVTIQWEAPELSNGPLLDYVVQFFEHPNGAINEKNSSEKTTKLESLKPNTLYTVRVSAQTEAGIGPSTDDLEVQTGIGVPGPPTNVSSVINATSIILTWYPPEHIPGHIADYLVSWGVKDTQASLVVIENEKPRYDAVGLLPYTEYVFDIAARTEAGAGTPEFLSLRTDVAIPTSPRKLEPTENTDSSILLRWFEPEHPNGPILNYQVKWSEYLSGEFKTHDTESNWYNITGLKPTTNYSLSVVAKTSAGQGPWSTVLVTSTKDKKPSSSNSGFILALALGITGRPREPSVEYINPRPDIQLVGLQKNPRRTFTVHDFEQKYTSIHRYGQSGFLQEFEELKKESPQHPCNAAKMEENLTKNRWVKILAFDHSRVKIQPDAAANRSNFINANYIPGDSYLLEYIATQGPLANTINDFWTAVWQQSVPMIVMLTQCVERAVKTCEKYWPNQGETKLYGDIQVQTTNETILTSHVLRVFLIQYQNQQRHVLHVHFTGWPAAGCPRSPEEFLHFIRVVRSQVSDKRPGPMLVHCSAGVGRTGTFIAMDRLMQHVQNKDDIDIYGTVLDMRNYRPEMVFTGDQYIFLYSCVLQMIQDRKENMENIYDTIS
ncbi:receptor-type tyrosine-protein phosphatase eta [Caerostris extrusa]|uniref:protein-tyrosine-phosphatase n=1 Tax=Caerostris extrusa TaxID=172846 RepID=A0AAV4UPZ8_CAEEX|nr:receptor-type tyrosine-protein phosphatase eta [Caerostris extrusa]